MSHLATELEALMKEKKLRASELSRLSGITEAGISRIRTGSQLWVASEDLQKLAAAFDPTPATHARLLRARLLDERVGPGASLVDVTIRAESAAEVPAVPLASTKLPPRVEHALSVIARHIMDDKELRNIVLGLGNLYDKGRLSAE